MQTKMIAIDGQTLAEAKRKATAACEPDWHVISEVVHQEGSEGSVTGFGETVAEAQAQARSKPPPGGTVLHMEKHEGAEGRGVDVTLSHTPRDEAEVKNAVALSESERIASVTVSDPGRPGFLGIGRRSPTYRVKLQTMR